MKSTLISIHNPRFLCQKCLTKNISRPEIAEKERKILGCNDIQDNPIHKMEGINYHTCIGKFYSESAINWIEMNEYFEKGIMPFSGNYMDQPAKVIEAMRVISNYKINWQLEKAKKEHLQKRGKMNHGR